MIRLRLSTSLYVAAGLTLLPATLHAQAQGGGWFVPPQAAPHAAAAAPRAAPRGRPVRSAPLPAPIPQAVPQGMAMGDPEPDSDPVADAQRPAPNLPQPPAPPLPDIVSVFTTATGTGDPVLVTATGPNAALPAPLAEKTTYYVIRTATKDAQNSVTLATSPENATAGTAIALENAGAGTLHINATTTHTGQANVGGDFTVALPSTLKLLPGGSAPPAPVLGVLGVPDVMRLSSAAQAVDKVVGARKERLQLEVQRAQANWRELEQQLQNDAPKLTREVGMARERSLRERVNADRRRLQEENRIIQEAAQVSLGQIERTLIGIIRQVAESRGMNVVLHRSQVALNVQPFDITDAVAQQLNRALPTVQIPPDNVDPATLPKDWGSPTAAGQATR